MVVVKGLEPWTTHPPQLILKSTPRVFPGVLYFLLELVYFGVLSSNETDQRLRTLDAEPSWTYKHWWKAD